MTIRHFVVLACLTMPSTQALRASEPQFNRDIRPILSDKCFICHGPDEESRQADLRLDVEAGGKSAIASGALQERILSEDDDLRMPPPETALELSETEKKSLLAWIDAGGDYAEHWAFTPLPRNVPIPEFDDASWIQQPIDAFVLRRLEDSPLNVSRDATPLRWLRRATFDLIGLPPTSQEIDTFLADLQQSPDDARRRVVERILSRKEFGEHMAVAWLDAARYADSYGFQSDNLNTQWPYRDWVVRAFNDNLPYDEFLTWQLAGDLLPDPTRDQRLATTFNRLHRMTNEGGSQPEEWRVEGVADRVHTFGTSILGLTLECCRCHDHKYDPISSREYYSLFAFFNSIDEYGMYDRSQKVPPPSMLLPTPEQREKLEQADAALEQAHANCRRVLADARTRYRAWREQLAENSESTLVLPAPRVAVNFSQPFDDDPDAKWYPVTDNRAKCADLPRRQVVDSTIPPFSGVSESPRQAVALDGDRGIAVKGIPGFDRFTPMTLVITLRETERSPQRSVIAHHTEGTDAGFHGWDLTIVDGHLESRVYRVWPGNAIGVRTVAPVDTGDWTQIAVTYDGSSRASGLRIFAAGRPLETITLRDQGIKGAQLGGGSVLGIGQRFRSRGLAGGLIEDVRYFDRPLAAAELSHLATATPITPTWEYYRDAVDRQLQAANQRRREAVKQLVDAENSVHEVPVMEELATPRPAHWLARGVYTAPRTEETRVSRGVPENLNPRFPEDAPLNRLGLAKWITLPDHPLTARVFVNRLWANFFGRGLVDTPENFGLQGALPTHPDLLDWLARDFIDHGWDVKRLCRQIVLSRTYGQDSAVSAAQNAQDPENRLLGRGPAFRLSAEQIRDLALASSGLLNRSLGGPPVSPYQAGGDLWRESNGMSPPYRQSTGKSLYRRSLYSVWKRTAPLPNMLAFDASTREVCSVSRSRTNTPLQALVLLNDVQFLESSRTLAQSILLEEETETTRIGTAFLELTGRRPTEQEQRQLTKLFQDERSYYLAHPEDAKALLSHGEHAVASQLDSAELAAYTSVCHVILSLDATVWRR